MGVGGKTILILLIRWGLQNMENMLAWKMSAIKSFSFSRFSVIPPADGMKWGAVGSRYSVKNCHNPKKT